MNYITFPDISYAQGRYDMSSDLSPIVEMKMTGFYYGSKVGYPDQQAARNYANAKQLGKIPILYHFAGGASPLIEADYFVNIGCSPLANGDIYELDYELTDEMNPPKDPDSWCRAFADRVKSRTGTYPLFYTNTSIFLRYNKFPKTMQVCSLIIADYRYTPQQIVPCGHTYIIHQFTDTPMDTNALLISLDILKKYGYHSSLSTSTTTHTTTTQTTTSTSTSTTTVPPIIINDPLPPMGQVPTVPSQPLVIKQSRISFWKNIWDFILKILYRRHV